jgi:sec-independent protein translocase protein TatA
MGSMSLVHWLVVLGVALLLFGNRLPTLGKSLGSGIRNFKSGLNGEDEEENASGKGPVSQKQIAGQKDGMPSSQENSRTHNS